MCGTSLQVHVHGVLHLLDVVRLLKAPVTRHAALVQDVLELLHTQLVQVGLGQVQLLGEAQGAHFGGGAS